MARVQLGPSFWLFLANLLLYKKGSTAASGKERPLQCVCVQKNDSLDQHLLWFGSRLRQNSNFK